MTQYAVRFAPEFDECLEGIADYMEFHGRSDASIARYIAEVYDTCDSYGTFQNRGSPRDDVMPGIKITHVRGETSSLTSSTSIRIRSGFSASFLVARIGRQP